MTIPIIFTKIKRKVEGNTHLDDKSKLIVLHILKQVFKEIPREDLIDYSNNTPEYKGNPADLNAVKNLFGDVFK